MRINALENAFHSQAVACHQVHHPEIDVLSATEAKGTWYLRDWFMDLKYKVVTEGSALYRDTYVKRDGRWLFLTLYIGFNRTEVSVKDLAAPGGGFEPLIIPAAGKAVTYEVAGYGGKFYVSTNDDAPRNNAAFASASIGKL